MFRLSVFLFAVLVFLSGCGTASVVYTVKRPAPVSMKGHKNIAVGDFKGYYSDHADLVASELAKHLLESGCFNKVLNREYLGDVLSEHKMQLAGITESKNLSRIGKISGASVIIYGSIDTDNYQEDVSRKLDVVTNTQSDKVVSNGLVVTVTTVTVETNRIITRKGYYNLAVNFQMVDVETSELLLVKRFSSSASEEKRGVNDHPGPIDASGMFFRCVDSVVSQLVGQLTPYYDQVTAEFQLDNDLPGVDNAMQKIRKDQYDESLKLFVAMTNDMKLKPKVRAKTVYNLGIALFLKKNYPESEQLIGKAAVMNPDEDLYDRALSMVRREAENDRKLKEQE